MDKDLGIPHSALVIEPFLPYTSLYTFLNGSSSKSYFFHVGVTYCLIQQLAEQSRELPRGDHDRGDIHGVCRLYAGCISRTLANQKTDSRRISSSFESFQLLLHLHSQTIGRRTTLWNWRHSSKTATCCKTKMQHVLYGRTGYQLPATYSSHTSREKAERPCDVDSALNGCATPAAQSGAAQSCRRAAHSRWTSAGGEDHPCSREHSTSFYRSETLYSSKLGDAN